jgi:SsrA-binding protein
LEAGKVGARLTEKTVAENRRARHDYFIEEVIEAGLVLTGTEVKSLRAGRANLQDAYAAIQDGEAWLYNCHISPYAPGNRYNVDPYRVRKLLLHRGELDGLFGKVRQKGYTLVPLRLFFNAKGKAKVAIGLGKGKKLYDKREAMAERDAQREMERVARGKS